MTADLKGIQSDAARKRVSLDGSVEDSGNPPALSGADLLKLADSVGMTEGSIRVVTTHRPNGLEY
jgi:hypothetical protein